MNTRFSDHEFSLNTLITIFFAYFDISTELATGSSFRMHGDRNNFYLIAFIFSEYQQKVRKIKYNQSDFLSKVMIRFITVPFRPGTITYSMNKNGINGAIQSTPVISCIFLFFPAGQNLSNCFHAIWSKRKTLYKQILPAFSFENMYSLAKLW